MSKAVKAQKTIVLGIPKGSLQEATVKIFSMAGFRIGVSERSYFPSIDDDQINLVLVRAQEISRYVEEGVLDCGITGEDWIRENDSNVARLADLVYAKQSLRPVRWVLAVSDDAPIHSVKNLQGKRVATELVKVTQRFLKDNHVNAEVEFSWGATEAKVKRGLVDAIVELTETGASLRANGLRIVTTVCESTTKFIANKQAYKDAWKKKKIDNIVLLLQGAIEAYNRVGLKLNVHKKNLEKVRALLPALNTPTVSSLMRKDWYALEVVVEERIVRELIIRLKDAGAEGIIEYSLNKIVY